MKTANNGVWSAEQKYILNPNALKCPTMAKSLGLLKEDLYHVQWLLANAPLRDNERVILQGLEIRLKGEIGTAEKPKLERPPEGGSVTP